MMPRLQLHTYWANPDPVNAAETYSAPGTEKRSKYLIDIVTNLNITTRARILEIGCNTGRNLYALKQAGYNNLSGIEISNRAIQVGKAKYGDLGTIYNISVESILPLIPPGNYDLVFSMAVFEHISPESNFIFKDISVICDKYIVTIEDEEHDTDRHCARNYGDIFSKLDMQQIFAERTPEDLDMGPGFVTRVMEKR